MKQAERSRLLRELVGIKDRLRAHGVQVTFSRGARSLKEHIADIKRRDEIEALLEKR